MRAAHNTANLMVSMGKESIDPATFGEIVAKLRDYLPAFNKSDELEADPEALRALGAMNG